MNCVFSGTSQITVDRSAEVGDKNKQSESFVVVGVFLVFFFFLGGGFAGGLFCFLFVVVVFSLILGRGGRGV